MNNTEHFLNVCRSAIKEPTKLDRLEDCIEQQLREAAVRLAIATVLEAARAKAELANGTSRLYINHSTNIWATMPVLIEAVRIGAEYSRICASAALFSTADNRESVVITIDADHPEITESDIQRIEDRLKPELEGYDAIT